jgi:glycerophosphoryl diester phosphodiesterase
MGESGAMRKGLDTDFFAVPLPRVIAHRGDSAEYPENTMPAFRAAVETRADYIELDVHLTRDGQVVVVHDEGLSRIASDDRLVVEMTMAELETIDAAFNFAPAADGWLLRGLGIRVPKLEEVLKSWPTLRFVIEFKPRDPAIADSALEVVRAAGMERRVLFASEHLAPIARARLLAPRIPTNLPAAEIVSFIQTLPSRPYAGAGDALQIPPEYRGIKLATREVIAAAHRSGLEVHVWTINDQAEMEEMLSLGVDGIITDYPSRLLALLRSRQPEG